MRWESLHGEWKESYYKGEWRRIMPLGTDPHSGKSSRKLTVSLTDSLFYGIGRRCASFPTIQSLIVSIIWSRTYSEYPIGELKSYTVNAYISRTSSSFFATNNVFRATWQHANILIKIVICIRVNSKAFLYCPVKIRGLDNSLVSPLRSSQRPLVGRKVRQKNKESDWRPTADAVAHTKRMLNHKWVKK